MKKLGIIILVIGLAITLFTGLNLVTKKEVLDVGDLHVSVNENHRVDWSPIVGVAVMVVGGAVYFMGSKK